MANLHVDSLSSKLNRTSFERALETLSGTSDAFYIEALERIDIQEAELRDLAFLVLSWVSYSERPMKMIELRYALAMSMKTDVSPISDDDLHEEAVILSSCAGLIKFNAEWGEVTFIRECSLYFK